jgi:valyl-tRNA synthetase
MMMMGLKFMGDVPFRTVCIHPLVRDAEGQKMSKSRGNVIDPLDVIHGATLAQLVATAEKGRAPAQAVANIKKSFPDGFPASGSDALRFALAAMAAQGRNIRLSIPRIEGYRHFVNKIWNASRFALMNLEGFDADRFADTLASEEAKSELGMADRWILSRLQTVVTEVDEAMNAFRLNDAAQALYRFMWTDVCDWYIELAKPALHEPAEGESSDLGRATRRRMAQGTLAHVLEHAMRLLHPLMPFITEEIWQTLPKPSGAPGSIMITMYPAGEDSLRAPPIERTMTRLMDVTVALRNLRAEYNIPSASPVSAQVRSAVVEDRQELEEHVALIERLTRFKVAVVDTASPAPEGFCARAIVGGDLEIVVPLAGVVDIAAEKARLDKELTRVRKEAESLARKLGNASFVERAPADVVAKDRARLADEEAKVARLQSAIAALG